VLPVLGAAAVGFCALGLYVAAWRTFVAGSTCLPDAMGDCMGAPLAMVLVGLPVLYVVWAVGLRLCGAHYPWMAPPAIGLGLFVLARIIGPYETPVLVWLIVAAALSAGWRWWLRPGR
jgi:hypothetical protein